MDKTCINTSLPHDCGVTAFQNACQFPLIVSDKITIITRSIAATTNRAPTAARGISNSMTDNQPGWTCQSLINVKKPLSYYCKTLIGTLCG
jgi:hypothetical protein